MTYSERISLLAHILIQKGYENEKDFNKENLIEKILDRKSYFTNSNGVVNEEELEKYRDKISQK